jgi:peptide/nickel transport system ATP-binding protein
VTAIIKASDVTVRFSPQAPAAVCSVSLEISPGGSLGIVGESGSGKTTLARALVGAIRPTSGEILVGGLPWERIRRTDDQRRRVQMVFQDPYGALNSWRTARKTVAEVLRQWDRVRAGSPAGQAAGSPAGRMAGDLLREVGLQDDLIDRRPRQLSGGQCQRVGIARALACEPDVLVADEPTSSLDVSVQAQILNLLASLRESRGLSLVVVSHDLGVVQFITTDLIVMYRGHVVEQGPTLELLANPRHPYTRLLVDSIPGQEGSARSVATGFDPPSGCVFAHRCGQVGEDCLSAPPALLSEGGRAVACVRPLR